MRKKIIFVDPKSSISHLMTRLRSTGWEVEELLSANCQTSLVTNRADITDIVFSLSGSDFGISIAHNLNMQLGLSDSIDSTILYNKVAQYHFMKAVMPHLTFDETTVFNSKDELKFYLIHSQRKMVIRPSVSYANGSAILYQGNYAAIESDINRLFSSAEQVLVHPFTEGKSYFVNGIVFDGKLFLTDAWQCFNIIANQRYILTSVISLPINHVIILNMHAELQGLCKQFGLRFSPIHFEVLLSNNDKLKIIKMVPRLATEPLPTLCKLAGIKSQVDAFYSVLTSNFNFAPKAAVKLKNHVADYSFVVRNSGHLIKTEKMNIIFQLPSYHSIYYLPAIGAFLPKTVCGATYGATTLLVNNNQNEIMNDIQICQKLNESNLLEISTT